MRRTNRTGGPRATVPVADDHRDPRRAGPGEYARRRSLLHEDPDIEVVDMAALAAIATAMEDEAVRRYTLLAESMHDRGEPATAAAFRVMLKEERRHVTAVARWAESVGEPTPAAEAIEWHLPADLSSSWEEISGSALLTPYRAFAVAVQNEERAFSLYAYLAAHAQDPKVRAEAEKLGREELRHAALLRRWRRRAYHRERRLARPERLQVDSVGTLRGVLARHEAAIAAVHRALVPRLRRAGDEAGARLLERAIAAAPAPAASAATPPESPQPDTGGGEDPRHLLVDAQKPLEALADVLEGVMATAEGELFEEAATAMAGVIERIAAISLRTGGPGPA